ncbi:MAG TPA: hypothetical protein VF188_01080 [Longimicrobiales bacterium]
MSSEVQRVMEPVATGMNGLYARVRASAFLRQVTVIVRVFLAISFILPGMIKVMRSEFGFGLGFDSATPIGSVFGAFYGAGAWYAFVGWAQVGAGLLLLLPSTATLGAVMYFPVILNIFLLRLSTDIGGAPVAPAMMVLASAYLLVWDYDRLKRLLPGRHERAAPMSRRAILLYPAGCGIAALVGFWVLAWLHVADLNVLGWVGAALALVAGAAFGALAAWHRHGMAR